MSIQGFLLLMSESAGFHLLFTGNCGGARCPDSGEVSERGGHCEAGGQATGTGADVGAGDAASP